jgi:hypothetical protein
MNTGNKKKDQKDNQNTKKVDLSPTKINVRLIRFEEFALSLEEHFHANYLHTQNPNSKPLGHR